MINGEKKWIGNGTLADVVVLWARDEADGEVKGFLVEKGTPGYAARVIDGQGLAARDLAGPDHLSTDLRVPAENRLPGANSFKDCRRGAGRHPQHRAPGRRSATRSAAYDIALTYASSASSSASR